MRPRRYFFAFVYICLFVCPQGKLDPVREVFDAFLGLYPYCYGYWKKYADLERKHSGNDTAKQVGNAPPLTCLVALCLGLGTRLPPPHTCTPTHPHTLSCILATYYNCTAVGRLTPLPNPNSKDIEMS